MPCHTGPCPQGHIEATDAAWKLETCLCRPAAARPEEVPGPRRPLRRRDGKAASSTLGAVPLPDVPEGALWMSLKKLIFGQVGPLLLIVVGSKL